MGSLYRKTLPLWRKRAPRARPGVGKDSSLTPSERREIQAQIDQILARNRMEIRPETLVFKPKRNGNLLPILINLLAVALAFAGIAGMRFLFDRSEGQIAGSSGRIESAEGRLLEALKKETREQLSRKDQVISSIQRQLEEVDRERRRAQAAAEARIREREAALRAQLQARLAQERQKMQREGVPASRIEEQLKALEARKAEELERQLAGFRQEAAAALKERENALSARVREYEQSLQQSRREQEKLRQELKARESLAANPPAGPADSAEQARARDQDRREQAAADQILSRYLQARADLESGRYPQALQTLEDLRGYLQQPAVASLPAVQKRMAQETFIIDSLESWIEAAIARRKEEAAPAAPPADPLAPVTTLLAAADRRFQRGELAQAGAIYRQALEALPAVRHGYRRLLEIEARQAQRLQRESDSRVAEGDRLLRSGDYRRALDRYAQSLEPQGDSRRWSRILAAVRESGVQAGRAEQEATLAARLEEANRRAAELSRQLEALDARRQLLRDRFRQAQAEMQRQAAAAAPAGQASPDRMLDLLRVKLRIREVLESEAVRGRYPGLYEGLEQLLAEAGAEQRRGGQVDGLRDASRILETITSTADLRALQAVWAGYGGSEEGAKELARILQAISRALE